MKSIKYLSVALAFISLTLSSCKDGSFGGKYEVEGVQLQDMCGTWVCSVEANDPWLTMLYYYAKDSETYTPSVLNGAFGDPYGVTNPDANGDGIVDEKDFDVYEQEGLWADFYGEGPYEFHTANTAANNTTEMFIVDGFNDVQYKVNVDFANKTFSAPGSIVNASYTTIAVNPVTINKIISNGEEPVVIGGKILKGAAHAPVSGMQTDSIFFYVKYADDLGQDVYYKVSGYLKSGHTEDD